jgi:hypothetical protein
MSQVIRRILPVSQPHGSKKCWAAVTAMILGRTGDGIVNQIMSEARAAGVPIQANDSLMPDDIPKLATAFHLNYATTGSDVLSGQDVADRLSGGACGLFGEEKAGKHAVACHGMVGDFSSSSTSTILGVDPRGFTAINMSFWDFQNQFAVSYIVYR